MTDARDERLRTRAARRTPARRRARRRRRGTASGCGRRSPPCPRAPPPRRRRRAPRASSTAAVPLSMSRIPDSSASRGPMARIVLAPPVRPLPIVRGSVPPGEAGDDDAPRDATDQVAGGDQQDARTGAGRGPRGPEYRPGGRAAGRPTGQPGRVARAADRQLAARRSGPAGEVARRAPGRRRPRRRARRARSLTGVGTPVARPGLGDGAVEPAGLGGTGPPPRRGRGAGATATCRRGPRRCPRATSGRPMAAGSAEPRSSSETSGAGQVDRARGPARASPRRASRSWARSIAYAVAVGVDRARVQVEDRATSRCPRGWPAASTTSSRRRRGKDPAGRPAAVHDAASRGRELAPAPASSPRTTATPMPPVRSRADAAGHAGSTAVVSEPASERGGVGDRHRPRPPRPRRSGR